MTNMIHVILRLDVPMHCINVNLFIQISKNVRSCGLWAGASARVDKPSLNVGTLAKPFYIPSTDQHAIPTPSQFM